ncbi:MAG: Atg14 domain-containing protein [Bacteroidia bacterium]|jgi:hypothetical protein|nr:Atg14 domain-containing protein [Bacteroidia bacterium]
MIFNNKFIRLFICLALLLLSERAIGQSPKNIKNLEIFRNQHKDYLTLYDLTTLTFINSSDSFFAKMEFRMVNENNDSLIINSQLLINTGISTPKVENVTIRGNMHQWITKDSFLLPGKYKLFHFVNATTDSIYSFYQSLSIANYQIQLNEISNDTFQIKTMPATTDKQLYLVVYKHQQPVNSYLINDSLFIKPPLTDTLHQFYELHWYAQQKLVAKHISPHLKQYSIKTFLSKLNRKYQQQKILKVGGTVGIEYATSTIPYNAQQVPNTYTRYFLNPEISILGLPFRAHVVHTTEQSSQFPMNTFNFEFDVDRFQELIKNRAFAQLTKANEEIEANAYEQINLEKSNLDLHRKISLDSIQLAQLNDSDRVSVNKKRILSKQIADRKSTLSLNEQRIESLRNRNIKLQQLHAVNRTLNAPSVDDTTQKYIRKQNTKWLSRLSKINAFKIGLVYPEFNELLYSGLPMRGLYINYALNRVELKFATGNIPVLLMNQPNNLNQQLSVRMIGVKVYNKPRTQVIKVESARFVNINGNQIQNNVLLIGTDYYLSKSVLFTSEIAKSSFDFSTMRDGSNIKSASLFSINELEHICLSSGIQINVDQTQFKLTYKRIDRGFQSLGSPFLRNDANQLDFLLEQQFHQRRIIMEIGGLLNTDNLSGAKVSTTQIWNWQAKIKIRYPYYPKFTLVYKPMVISSAFNNNFQMNPEFNSQQVLHLNSLSVQTDHQFKTGTISHKPMLVYNQFNQYNQTQSFTVSIYQFQWQTDFNKQWYANLIWIHQFRTNPTATFQSTELNITYRFSKIMTKLTSGIRRDFTLTDAKRDAVFIQVSKSYQSFSFSCQTAFARLNGLWGDQYLVSYNEYRMFINVAYTLPY